MRIPDVIKISGHFIKVRFKKSLFLDDKHCIGLSYLNANKIELATHAQGEKLPESRKAEAFLHEIGHFVNTLHSIGLSEAKLDAFILGLFQAIRDNNLDFRK